MQFNMKCETYSRLNNALQWFKPNEKRDCFRSIYIERKAGYIIAVATNSKILAAELLGHFPGPDGYMNLTIDPVLVAQCRTEAQLNSLMNINHTPELRYAVVKTTFGYQYPNNAALHFDSPNVVHERWRKIPDTEIDAGPMIMQARDVAQLGDASPSGFLVFPTEIDGNKPVVVRDKIDPNWFGMFMPDHYDDNGKRLIFPAATIPDWAK